MVLVFFVFKKIETNEGTRKGVRGRGGSRLLWRGRGPMMGKELGYAAESGDQRGTQHSYFPKLK